MLPNRKTNTSKKLDDVVKITGAAIVEITIRYAPLSMAWQIAQNNYKIDPKQSYSANSIRFIQSAFTNPDTKQTSLSSVYTGYFKRLPTSIGSRVYTFAGHSLLAKKFEPLLENKIIAHGAAAATIGVGYHLFKPGTHLSLQTFKHPTRLLALFTVPLALQENIAHSPVSKKEKRATQFVGAATSVLVSTLFSNVAKKQPPSTPLFSFLFAGAIRNLLTQSLPLTFIMILNDQFTKDNQIQEKTRKYSR